MKPGKASRVLWGRTLGRVNRIPRITAARTENVFHRDGAIMERA